MTASHPVPYLSEQEIETNANLLLQEFVREQREITDLPIPIDDIVELHLRLTFELRDLKKEFKGRDVLGALYVGSKIVAVDLGLDPSEPNQEGRFHFTLAHEVAHWWLHRPYLPVTFAPPSEGGGERPTVVCRSSEKKERIEWQADQFASYLLMPEAMVRWAWRREMGRDEPLTVAELAPRRREMLAGATYWHGGFRAFSSDDDTALLDLQARHMARRFRVSRSAMRIRLEKLGLFVRSAVPALDLP
jgi:hypothetical protein